MTRYHAVMLADKAVFLRQIRLRSYKCFRDSGPICFKDGINIVAGANNVGKTALLQAAALQGGAHPHMSETSKPNRAVEVHDESVFEVTLEASVDYTPNAAMCPWDGRKTESEAADDFASLVARDPVSWIGLLDAYGNQIHPEASACRWIHIQKSPSRQWRYTGSSSGEVRTNQSFFSVVSRGYRDGAFVFGAQRLHTGTCAVGSSHVLVGDARNLPDVLNTLQANPVRFARFNSVVRRVLSSITRVSVRTVGGSELEVLVWKGSEDSDRLDLASPLNQCGTGVSQVLALLYVVTQSSVPRTILIDEPNTFLHPGAVASLIEILKEYKQHQYVITTHSPAVIAAAEPSTLHLLVSEGYETRVHRLSPQEIDGQSRMLHAVGARLEDVFGPDRVLWVEGPSEVQAFPRVARAFKIPIARVAFLPLVNVGDLEGPLARAVTKIYQNLTNGIALIPPACGFILDREDRTSERAEQIQQAAPGRLRFLARRMLENYLLHPAGIVQLMKRGGEEVLVADVEAQIRSLSPRAGGTKCEPFSAQWLQTVRGDKLLGAVVGELSQHRLRFDKTCDVPVLIAWALEHDIESLKEIADLLREALQAP